MGHKISSLIRFPTWVPTAGQKHREDSTQSSAHWWNEARLQSVSLCIICNVRLRKPPEAGSGPFPSQETNLALKHKNVYKKGVELDSSHH